MESDRLEELETRLAYAEYTVEQLNNELTKQGQELDKLRYKFQLLVEKMLTVTPAAVASAAEEHRHRTINIS